MEGSAMPLFTARDTTRRQAASRSCATRTRASPNTPQSSHQASVLTTRFSLHIQRAVNSARDVVL
eukprot:8266841-Pyramimonas_sp.AAC.1